MYEDPETQQMIKGKTGDALMWRLLLSGCQGEIPAIKEILDRIDGKVIQELSGEIKGDTKVIIIEREREAKSNSQAISVRLR